MDQKEEALEKEMDGQQSILRAEARSYGDGPEGRSTGEGDGRTAVHPPGGGALVWRWTRRKKHWRRRWTDSSPSSGRRRARMAMDQKEEALEKEMDGQQSILRAEA